jgi:hypothetical protein
MNQPDNLARILLNLQAAAELMLEHERCIVTVGFAELTYEVWASEGSRRDWLAEQLVRLVGEARAAHEREAVPPAV